MSGSSRRREAKVTNRKQCNRFISSSGWGEGGGGEGHEGGVIGGGGGGEGGGETVRERQR